MSLFDYGEWMNLPCVTNVFRSRFCAAIVHDNNLEIRRVRLARQRLQALLEQFPIVVNRDDDAEPRWHYSISFALSHEFNGQPLSGSLRR